jgi:hypothetical protein
LKKKIIAISLMMAFLMMLYVHSAAAQNEVTVYAWTDRVQYNPGETGTLYITVRNDLPDTDVIIKNISIVYDSWYAYVKDHWEGNQSFMNINQICTMKGGVYYKEVTFTVPTGGRGVTTHATITVMLDKPEYNPGPNTVQIDVVEPPYPMTITNMDMWMTSLIVVIVICTIILAIVIFLSTRRTPAAPRVIAPPPTKAKAE